MSDVFHILEDSNDVRKAHDIFMKVDKFDISELIVGKIISFTTDDDKRIGIILED